jgi:hypothetical protein
MKEPQPKVAAEPWDVDANLAALGLKREQLREAVRLGELERVSCTDLDPQSFPGTTAWAHTIRYLRADLLLEGWVPQNKNNLPLTVHPVRHLGILVTSGSPGTGDPDGEPTTKYPKGPMTASQVKANRQLLLFGDTPRVLRVPRKDDVVTWCLLVYAVFYPRNETIGTHIAKCELSLPAAIDEDGYVCEWGKRIILEPVRLDDIPTRRDIGDEDGGEIDVPVKRR